MQELKNNLFFVGIKHSGKTTFASRIASRINVESSDSDDLILETLGGESVREYYRREGKEAFMRKEVGLSILVSLPIVTLHLLFLSVVELQTTPPFYLSYMRTAR